LAEVATTSTPEYCRNRSVTNRNLSFLLVARQNVALVVMASYMRFIDTVYVLVALATCLAQSAVAQNCFYSTSKPATTTGEQKIVVVELSLNRSGKVHGARVDSGPATLAGAALRAAKRNTYPSFAKEKTIFVSVTFAADGKTVTDVKRTAVGGVPGCVGTPEKVRVSQQVMQKMLVSRIEPEYPPEALTARIEGIVVLGLLIDRDGSVSNVEKISGSDVFTTAATNAVKQWKFRPFYVNGEVVKVVTTMDVAFLLTTSGAQNSAANPFTADISISSTVMPGMSGRLYVSGNRIRLDWGEMADVFDLKTRQGWRIFGGNKVYIVLGGRELSTYAPEMVDGSMCGHAAYPPFCKLVTSEVVEGRAARKWDLYDPVKVLHVYYWIDEVHAVTLRIAIGDTATYKVSNVQVGAVPDSMFELTE